MSTLVRIRNSWFCFVRWTPELFVLLMLAFMVSAFVVEGDRSSKKRYSSPEIDTVKDWVSKLSHRQLAILWPVVDSNLNYQDTMEQLRAIAVSLPDETPRAVDVVYAHTSTTENPWIAVYSLQYEFASGWRYVSVMIERTAAKDLRIRSIDVLPLEKSLRETHRMSFGIDKSWQMSFLALASLFTVTIVVALVRCLRDKALRHRLAWTIFIIFGLSQLNLNWTTGSIEWNMLASQLLGSGYYRSSEFQPLVVVTSIPLGAVLFLTNSMYAMERQTPRANKTRSKLLEVLVHIPRSLVLVAAAYIICYVGAVDFTSFVLTAAFGDVSDANPPTGVRMACDFTISFLFQVLAGYVGARLSRMARWTHALAGPIIYFVAIFVDSWSSDLINRLWPWWYSPLMLIKIFVAAIVGAYIALDMRGGKMRNLQVLASQQL